MMGFSRWEWAKATMGAVAIVIIVRTAYVVAWGIFG